MYKNRINNIVYTKVLGVALVFLDLYFQQRYIPQVAVSSRAEGTYRKSYFDTIFTASQVGVRVGVKVRTK
jgi:hypothetical protein